MNPNYEKLKAILQLANDGVSKSENVAQMAAMLKLVVKLRDDIEKKHTESMKSMDEMYKMMFAKLNLAGLEERVSKTLSNVKNGTDGKHGRDGKDADVMEAVTKVMELVKPDDMKKEHKAEMEKMHAEMEAKMKEEMEKMKKDIEVVKNKPMPRMGMRKVPAYKRVNLTSLTNGSTRDFVLPRDTVDVLGVWGSDFPNNYNPLVDWTFTGNTLTVSSDFNAPRTGTTLFCIIETLFY